MGNFVFFQRPGLFGVAALGIRGLPWSRRRNQRESPSSILGCPRVRGVDVVKGILSGRPAGEITIWGTRHAVLTRLPRGVIAHSGFEAEESQASAEKHIVATRPRFLILCLGSPRQEETALRLAPQLPDTLILPAGGSVDALMGDAVACPKWLYFLGLEWAVRAVAQPRRFLRLPRMLRTMTVQWWRGG